MFVAKSALLHPQAGRLCRLPVVGLPVASCMLSPASMEIVVTCTPPFSGDGMLVEDHLLKFPSIVVECPS
jgi:hypothetical protein